MYICIILLPRLLLLLLLLRLLRLLRLRLLLIVVVIVVVIIVVIVVGGLLVAKSSSRGIRSSLLVVRNIDQSVGSYLSFPRLEHSFFGKAHAWLLHDLPKFTKHKTSGINRDSLVAQSCQFLAIRRQTTNSGNSSVSMQAFVY